MPFRSATALNGNRTRRQDCAELGVAWKKTAKNERDYLSVKLDAPSLPREIFAKLFDSEDGYDLVWSRPRPKDKTAPKAPAE